MVIIAGLHNKKHSINKCVTQHFIYKMVIKKNMFEIIKVPGMIFKYTDLSP